MSHLRICNAALNVAYDTDIFNLSCQQNNQFLFFLIPENLMLNEMGGMQSLAASWLKCTLTSYQFGVFVLRNARKCYWQLYTMAVFIQHAKPNPWLGKTE